MTPLIIEVDCPGCGLRMPRSSKSNYAGYYHASEECWSVYTEVLGDEYSNAFLFGRVHQVTVDTYAVQHSGGPHPDKSMDVHLTGLYLVMERDMRPTDVPPILQRLAAAVETWPHFTPPAYAGPLTVFDVAMSSSLEEHIDTVRKWGRQVWNAWSHQHDDILALLQSTGVV